MDERKPLKTPTGFATFVGEVGRESIRNLLKGGAVRFVVDDFLGPMKWIPDQECFDFWKSGIQRNLAEPDQSFCLEDWPGEYVYSATRWYDGGRPIILLTMHHWMSRFSPSVISVSSVVKTSHKTKKARRPASVFVPLVVTI